MIDFEVAHVGDPVFDLAFLQAHLLLKSVAAPLHARALAATAEAFLCAYGSGAPPVRVTSERLALHVGCLVLARVDGTSPVDYLTPEGTAAARQLGVALVDGECTLDSAWEQVTRG